MSLPVTPSQTVGPFYRIGLEYRFKDCLCEEDVPGERITIAGTIYDGQGVPVPDALLELWQADYKGVYPGVAYQDELATAGFAGFARVPVDDAGRFRFRTIKPGAVTAPANFTQAPHIVVLVFLRGILRHLHTRIYFPDSMNDVDPVLQAVPAHRRSTLIATPAEGGSGEYLWNIHLQGGDETVFFAY